MKSLAFLLIIVAQCAPSSQSVFNVKDFSDALAGTFDVTSNNFGHPTMATIVHTSDNQGLISVEMFPIETCQAVKLCIIEKLPDDKSNKITLQQNFCENSTEWYPPTGKIVINAKGKPQKTGYTTKLAFERSETSYQIDLTQKPFSRKEIQRHESKTPALVDLTEKTLIVLTNSRQCHAQVAFAGRVTFHEILTTTNVGGEFPKVFAYEKANTPLETFFTNREYAGNLIKRKFDSLPYVKKLIKAKSEFGKIKFKCSVSGNGLTNGEKIMKHSVLIAEKLNDNSASQGSGMSTSMIALSVIDCHWVRLWFTKKSAWTDYATTIDSELHQTVDLFFHEAFALLPDRERAIQLPGSSRQIQAISIVHHGGGVVEISFGRIGNDFINPISFKMDIMTSDTFNVFMIRSPKCDARFSMGAGRVTGETKKNSFELRNCAAYSITET